MRETQRPGQPRFPYIAALGASAGGLRALGDVLANARPGAGVAYVVLQHLDPTQPSLMAELLGKRCPLHVKEITSGVRLEPDTVYVLPPDAQVDLRSDELILSARGGRRGKPVTIDHFMETVASVGTRAVGVVLSGTGSDGLQGLRAILNAGGYTIAQDPGEAEHASMPKSAIDAGVAKKTLPASRIAAEIARVANAADNASDRAEAEATDNPADNQHDAARDPTDGRTPPERPEHDQHDHGYDPHDEFHDGPDAEALDRIIDTLEHKANMNVRGYRRASLVRRVRRRMAFAHIRTIPEYAEHIEQHEEELRAFAGDIHIHVTEFFRDPEAFRVLQNKALPDAFRAAAERDEPMVRVWVPGAATGEEAYSIAIALLETRQRLKLANHVELRVFATDIDSDAIAEARRAVYHADQLKAVSEARKNRFFTRIDQHNSKDSEQQEFRVNQQVRDIVSFAVHDVLEDPPFSKLDIASCRNLLIYLDRDAQARALSLMHFGIVPGGYLLLGPSETARDTAMFAAVDKKWRLYRRLEGSRRLVAPGNATTANRKNRQAEGKAKPPQGRGAHHSTNAALRVIAETGCPPTVVCNEQFIVLYLHGELAEFLDLPSGAAELSLLDMLRQDIRTRVRAALYRAAREGETVVAEGEITARSGQVRNYHVRIVPANSRELGDDLLVVRFELLGTPKDQSQNQSQDQSQDHDGAGTPGVTQGIADALERELAATRRDLHGTVQELENANEELRSINEEATTMNEELQSSNEELETQAEELRSVNEELVTVNAQLREKIHEVEVAHADIGNLLSSTRLPAVFLDREFCVRRFTPEAERLLHVVNADVGRPLDHLAGACIGDGLREAAKAVLDKLHPVEKEIQTGDGRWYLRRILPYRTQDDRIDGVVITFSEVTRLKRLGDALKRSFDQQEAANSLGLMALAEDSLDTVLESVVHTVQRATNADLVKVLRVDTGERTLSLVAGVGWDERLDPNAAVHTGVGSQAGYTLQHNSPVIVEDSEHENRFTPNQILADHNVRSGISVVIRGPKGQQWGVLGAHCTQPACFEAGDADFCQQVANIISALLQRRHAEKSLRESEARFRAMAENIPQLAWMTDDTGTIQWYNRRWYEYTGQTEDQARGWGWKEVHHPDHIDSVVEHFTRAIERKEAWEDTFPLRRHDGEYRDFLSRAMPIKDEQGNVVRWFGTNTDITEQLRAEAKLIEARRELQAIIDNSPAAIYVKDRAGRFLVASETCATLAGKKPGDLVGKTDADFAASEQQQTEYVLNDRRVWSTGKPIEVEEIINLPEGPRVFLSQKFPLKRENGEMYALAGISTDITDRKASERHLEAVMAELNHRVKNSISVIEALSKQSAGRAGSLDEFVESFGNRLRSMSQSHSLLTATEWRGAELGDILEAELRTRVAQPKDLILEGESVWLNPRATLALHMAIHELATNASKYGALGEPGGSVRVEWNVTGEGDGRTLEIRWKERGGPPVRAPADDGFGTEMIDNAVCYELGGDVERSFEPRGFEARLRVPYANSDPAAATAPPAPLADPASEAVVGNTPEASPLIPQTPRGENNAGRVLLVEDSAILAKAMKSWMGERGFEVAGPCSSVLTAFRELKEQDIAAAVLDVDLGGEYSFAVADLLIARDTPVCFLTGYNGEDLPKRFQQVPTFAKPPRLEDLAEWLRSNAFTQNPADRESASTQTDTEARAEQPSNGVQTGNRHAGSDNNTAG